MLDYIANGLFNLPWWGVALYTLVMVHITVTGVTLYLHRDATHRGLDLHPVIQHFFRFWLWLTTAMKTKEWVAIHRKHHAHCETDADPHSPQVLGLKKVLFEGAELYRAEAAKPATLEKYGRGTPNDWIERNLYSRFIILGVSALLFINVGLMGALGLTAWAVQMMAIPLLAAGVINGVGHFWGYRNFECKDAATNVMPWGIMMGGEELHNNHHAFPSSAKFALRSWEFDIGWAYISGLKRLGLAKVRRVAPTPVLDAERPHMDLEAVKAVIVTRLHVLRDYYKHVTQPVLRAEMVVLESKVRAGAKRLLRRDPALLNARSQTRLNILLQENHTLKTVYEFRERLQKLWGSSTASNERLVQNFKDWCHEAEQSGIQALQDFAARLRSYTLAPAV